MEKNQKGETNPFVHLHVHSYFSQLDGMSSISGLVDKAIRCNMNALALTDHGNMYGAKEFYDYVKKRNKDLPEDKKIKAILGVEAYCARRTRFDKTLKEDGGGWHLILLAKNKKGYQNLCKLVSTSWIDGFYYRPRIDKDA
jgi:DNA polymerase-3 subunit alpha